MIREEFMIEQRGKTYVLYSGLLDAAHRKFASFMLETDLDGTSPEDKPRVIATFQGDYEDKGGDMHTIKTMGIGTAGRPSDGTGAAKEAPVEMAETRAKARALRDAVNVGATSLEEMPTTEAASLEEPIEGSQGVDGVSRQTLEELMDILKADADYKNVSLGDRIKALEDFLGYPIKQMSESEARGKIAQWRHVIEYRAGA
jgi:hypothetical protein